MRLFERRKQQMAETIDERKNELDEQLRAIIFQAVGEASMCWSETPTGVFDSEYAASIGEAIMQAIRQNKRLEEVNAEIARTMIHPHPKPFLSVYLFKAEIIAEIIRWGIRQNPYEGRLPRKTEIVIEKLHALLPESMIHVEDIRHFISSLLEQVPEIREWNLSQFEFEHHVKVDDETRQTYAFISRYGSELQPEHDFIDIDALKRNIIHALERERE